MAALVEASGDRDAESDDELPQLSEYARAALQEFYAEQESREQELQSRLAEGAAATVAENWV